MLRLPSNLIHLVETALSSEDAARALHLVVDAMEQAGPSVEGLRLAALAARLLNQNEAVERILRGAHRSARHSGDLIDAVDTLRRLDSLSIETETAWSAFLHQLARHPFAAPAPPPEIATVAVTQETTPSVDELVARALALAQAAGASDDINGPFSYLPLLDAFPIHELSAVLRGLQLRMAPEGTPIASVTNRAPAWITSGALRVGHRAQRVRIGTLIRPADTDLVAATQVRMVTLASEVWAEYRALPPTEAVFSSLDRNAKLIRILRRSGFFRSLQSATRHALLRHMQCATLTDAPIIHRGEAVRGLFLLVDGTAAILDGDAATEVATLHAGDVFGEFDVLTSAGAGYDVVARGTVDLCLLDAHHARRLLQNDQAARKFLVDLYDSRVASNKSEPNASPAPVVEQEGPDNPALRTITLDRSEA